MTAHSWRLCAYLWRNCIEKALECLGKSVILRVHRCPGFARTALGCAGHVNRAGVAKLVDAPDLGSGAARRGGSSPSTRTTTDLRACSALYLSERYAISWFLAPLD